MVTPWNKGKIGVYSPEQLKRMGEAQRKRASRPEERIRLSEIAKGNTPWNKGKTGVYSEETRRRISAGHKGLKPSVETRKKMSEAQKGRIAWNKGLKKAKIKPLKIPKIFIKKCENCGKEFIDKTHNHNKKFCSFSCRDHIANSKRREYILKYIKNNKDKKNKAYQLWSKTPTGKEAIRNSRLKHKDEIARYVREYRAREEVNARIKAWKRAYLKTEKGWARARWDSFIRRQRKRGTIAGYTKQEFLEKAKKTGGICPICKSPFTPQYHSKHELTLDHNPPISKVEKGFVYTIDMITPICRSCNSKKGNK